MISLGSFPPPNGRVDKILVFRAEGRWLDRTGCLTRYESSSWPDSNIACEISLVNRL